jgi:surfeit locus 1 family protein
MLAVMPNVSPSRGPGFGRIDAGQPPDGGPTPPATARRFRPRALPTLATLAAVAVCVAAGNWQQRRMHEKEALRAQLDAAAQAEPLALASLPAAADWAALRYRPVVAAGSYVAGRQILVDNRVFAGRAGFHVVTPLALADGRVVLVNRGWIVQGASRSTPPDAPPPAGPVSVRGRIALPARGYLELKPEAAAGPIWQNLDLARFAAATGLPVLPVIVEATAAPVPDDGLVRDWPAPDFGIETHRIYMIQWYAFALVAAVLWLWFNRLWFIRPRIARMSDG